MRTGAINCICLALSVFGSLGFVDRVAAAEGSIAPQQVTRKHDSVAKSPRTRPALALSLTDAVFLALRKNLAIRNAYVDRIAQQYDLKVAEDTFSPHATLAGSTLSQTSSGFNVGQATLSPNVTVLTPIGTQLTFAWDNSISLSSGALTRSTTPSASFIQPLLRGGGLDANLAPVQNARLTEHINQLTLRTTISQTITSVILAYRDLMRSERAKALAENAVVRAQALIDTDNALIQAGRMATMEIVQAQAGLENQKLAVLQSAQQLEVSRLALATLLNIDLATEIIVRDKLEPAKATVSLEEALKIAFKRRPDYLSQQDVVEQGRLGITLATNQRLWDISVFGSGSVGKQFTSGGGLPRSSSTIVNGAVGVNLNAPLNGLSLDQPVIHAKTSLSDAEIQFSVIRQGIEQQIRTSTIAIELSWQQLEVARRALALAATAVEIEKQKLNAGRSSNFQVQTLEANYQQAEAQNLNAEIDYVNALTNFDLQLGTTLDTWKITLRDN
jgi:outer membrane protein TolC